MDILGYSEEEIQDMVVKGLFYGIGIFAIFVVLGLIFQMFFDKDIL